MALWIKVEDFWTQISWGALAKSLNLPLLHSLSVKWGIKIFPWADFITYSESSFGGGCVFYGDTQLL